MIRRKISRRRFVTSTAALSSAMVAAPFVRGAYAAGKLTIGLLGPLGARRQQGRRGRRHGMG